MVWPFSKPKTQGLDSLRSSAINFVDKRIEKLEGRRDEYIETLEDLELQYFGLRPKIEKLDQILTHYNQRQMEIAKLNAQIQNDQKKEQEKYHNTQTVRLKRKSHEAIEEIRKEERNYTIVGRQSAGVDPKVKIQYVTQLLSESEKEERTQREIQGVLDEMKIGEYQVVRAKSLKGTPYEGPVNEISKKYPLANQFNAETARDHEKLLLKITRMRDQMEDLDKKAMALQAKIDRIRNNLTKKVGLRKSA